MNIEATSTQGVAFGYCLLPPHLSSFFGLAPIFFFSRNRPVGVRTPLYMILSVSGRGISISGGALIPVVLSFSPLGGDLLNSLGLWRFKVTLQPDAIESQLGSSRHARLIRSEIQGKIQCVWQRTWRPSVNWYWFPCNGKAKKSCTYSWIMDNDDLFHAWVRGHSDTWLEKRLFRRIAPSPVKSPSRKVAYPQKA